MAARQQVFFVINSARIHSVPAPVDDRPNHTVLVELTARDQLQGPLDIELRPSTTMLALFDADEFRSLCRQLDEESQGQ